MDDNDRREIENILRFKKELLKQQEKLKGLTKEEQVKHFIKGFKADKERENNE